MNAQEIILRPAQPTDARDLSIIHIAAIKALPATFYSPEELLAWRNNRDRPDNGNIFKLIKADNFWVAVIDNVITGFASYIDDELIALYVHPQYQGRGIGRNLVEHFCDRAREQGIDRVMTTASLYAEGFYSRLGFTAIARAPHYLSKGIIVPVTKMSKKLVA
ncbi:GNAT family N-acetyltransferase [Calothrix parietina]|uniref:GNAT family N-acetyltransferase n=1 Tax=Calothrix parietina FACHB-288 TaxID=2692896 RepID=A0ABR8AEE2_9CYAN|nr:GNAT family N-acetyltransferase [Calothrix parietina]MBD2198129.1 GNAT family N-acetyltransferase [Calothrix parietina FACHB-288]